MYAALSDEGLAARYAMGIHLLRDRVRGIHYLGGGYMNGQWEKNLCRLEVAVWAHERGIPSIATGTGLQPLRETDGSLDYVRSVVPSFDRFVLRDAASYEVVRDQPNCVLGVDDCFVNGLTGCYSAEKDLPNIMICIQSDLVSDHEALYRHVADVLMKWGVGTDEVIGVVECNPYVDYPILPYLESCGYRTRLFPAAYLLEHGLPAREGQRWLSTRYHPHLIAAAKGCGGSYISINSEYYAIKHEAVLRMGSRWTESRIGDATTSIGPGFSDFDMPQRYARQIRQSASVLYGDMPLQ